MVSTFLFNRINERLMLEEIAADRELGRIQAFSQHHQGYYFHQFRVRMMSLRLGMINCLSEDELRVLVRGALYHDIGKIQIPIDVLDGVGPLSREKVNLLLQHPRMGYEMLTEPRFEVARIIVHTHHDYSVNHFASGNGRRVAPKYPAFEGYQSESVRQMTQLVAACDIVDGLSNGRAYQTGVISLQDIEENLERDFIGNKLFAMQAFEILKYGL